MDNKDLSVLLQVELEKSGIHAELQEIQEIVDKYPLELTPDLQTASLENQFKTVCQRMADDFNKTFHTYVNGNDIFKVYEDKANELKQTIENVNEYQKSINAATDEKSTQTVSNETGIVQRLFNRENAKPVLDVIDSLTNALDWVTGKLKSFGDAEIAIGGFLGSDKSKQRFCPLWA